jgi:hypothetical protein
MHNRESSSASGEQLSERLLRCRVSEVDYGGQNDCMGVGVFETNSGE